MLVRHGLLAEDAAAAASEAAASARTNRL